jgi:HAD superfamily hydrolase (TIGR01509 family)
MLRAVPLQGAEIVGIAKLPPQPLEDIPILLLTLVAELTVHVPHQIRDDAVVVEQRVIHVEQRDDWMHGVIIIAGRVGLHESIRYAAVVKALIFDLDGTLVDTVYGHVFAWQRVLGEAGIHIDGWKIHRLIGMSGGLLVQAVARQVGHDLPTEQVEALQKRHGVVYKELLPNRRPLPGAVDLLRHLRDARIAFAIATSGKREDVTPSLAALSVPPDVIVVDRSDVARAKPEPDLFLAGQKRLKVTADECYVIGDSVWDLLAARRAGMLGVGLLSGGYGEQELAQAGAYRVYEDPADLLSSIYQLGLRST